MRLGHRLAGLACLALVLAACGGAEIEPTVEVAGVTVEDDTITMPVGFAVAVEVISAGDDQASAMITRDESVVGVAPTGRAHEYVVYGVQAGQSVLDIHIDGPREGSIEVVIETQQ
jgi:hypothetical protein